MVIFDFVLLGNKSPIAGVYRLIASSITNQSMGPYMDWYLPYLTIEP